MYDSILCVQGYVLYSVSYNSMALVGAIHVWWKVWRP